MDILNRRMNKKGMGIFVIVSLALVLLALYFLAIWFGFTMFSKTVKEIGLPTIIAFVAIGLALYFKGITEMVLKSIWGWITAIVNIALSLFK